MSSAANRGKWAEDEVKKHLKLLGDRNARFDWQRNQDAHAAGGHMSVPQTGDFAAYVMQPLDPEWAEANPNSACRAISRNFVIEVKEVKHAFRLPYKNFSADKVARVNKRALAGAEAIVLVCHMPDKVWRAVPQSFFVFDLDKPSGSWDLSQFPLVDYRTALNEFMGVTP